MTEFKVEKDPSGLTIVIENPRGTYKSFHTEGNPTWEQYPLKGVTYPVDYGRIEGYTGEDGAALDIFVGTGSEFGYIKIRRMDVPEETKFFIRLQEEELQEVLTVFKPVLITHSVLSEEMFMDEIRKFKTK